MSQERKIRVVGLTGGIASGKTTVARFLSDWGIPVIDADQLSREVVRPGEPAHAAIAARWPHVVGEDGAIDRVRLGEIVFADPAERAALTAVVIPAVIRAFRQALESLEAAGVPVCVFEAATLLEEGLETLVDGVLLVSLPAEEQLRRLMARSGSSEKQARQRLAAQLPLEAKRRRSHWIIDNRGSEADLARSTRETWEQVLREI